MAPITVWGSDTTRSDLIKASCAELGLDYTFVALDWNAKEHKGEAFLKVRCRGGLRGSTAPPALRARCADAAPRGRAACAQLNPFGQTPAFKDGDLLLVRAACCAVHSLRWRGARAGRARIA